jgi:hypothetical protein
MVDLLPEIRVDITVQRLRVTIPAPPQVISQLREPGDLRIRGRVNRDMP